MRFSLEKTIRADIEDVFDAATDVAALERNVPGHFLSVRLLSVRGNVSVAEEHIILAGRELVIMAKHVTDRPHTHETFVIGGDAKGSHITERYARVAAGTRLDIDVDLRLGGMLGLAGVFLRGRLAADFARIADGLAGIAER